ncbi:MAG: phosphoenolpyruvate synthase regulatory protein [Proteobacteria bacterium]|nr:MAG: phosphoenolpyruvate synthase regulatory protein [Pseudomonadota bacterium]
MDCDVFFVSEGTGITADELGSSLLSQFPQCNFNKRYHPFIDTIEKAEKLVACINEVAESQVTKPLVFATMANKEINKILSTANANYYEVFDNYLDKISANLGVPPKRESGLMHSLVNERQYDARIDAVNYTLAHDDAMVLKGLDEADIIMVGVSRSGKTPTCLYLALKYGIKAANYPLTSDDFDRHQFPKEILKYKEKLIVTTISPQRLHHIREKRRPNSRYASMPVCASEIKMAMDMYDRHGLSPLDVTSQSVEELATQIVKIYRRFKDVD